MNVLDILKERGFIEQATHEKELYELFEKEKVTFYIGFDPTADSLHVGHFITIMAMMHLQQAGHRPIALCGGGTGMIGDPSGKADMRRVMTVEEIDHNVNRFKEQLSRFIDFGEGKAILANNADWLRTLNYVELLRDVGWHFSVNRMLSADAFKVRMDRDMGLSFTEFNYMIMQAYDFYELHKRYGCKVQLGGSDQWSNIIQGVELIRRKEQEPAFGMTFKLLTNSEGQKMGKTVAGALWLDKEKCSPYDFYQYWRNIHDKDVEKCLSLLTFLPMEQVRELSALQDKEINRAKEVLAFEVTKIIHGEEEAVKAQEAAKSVFGGQGKSDLMPTAQISAGQFYGKDILSFMVDVGIVPTKSEGRRVVQQGGLKINGEKVDAIDYIMEEKDYKEDGCVIQKGKKVFLKVVLDS